MRNTNKKGFTIIELVIVIAVIAILAAVLIPTFAGIIRKANVSNDTVIAREINTIIATENAIDKFEGFEDVIEALYSNGFHLANLNAKTEGCFFVWDSETNQMLLVDAKDNFKVLFPENGYTAKGAAWNLVCSDKDLLTGLELGDITVKYAVSSATSINEIIAAGTTETIFIDENFEIEEGSAIAFDNAGEHTLILGESSLSTKGTINGAPVYVANSKLNVQNGTLNATGEFTNEYGKFACAIGYDGGAKLFVNNVNFIGVTGINGAMNKDGHVELVVENSTFDVSSVGVALSTGGNNSTAIINNCNITAGRFAIFTSQQGTVTVNGGTYKGGTAVNTGVIGAQDAGTKVIVNGGTFEGALIVTNNATLEINGGTFTVDPSAYVNEETHNVTESNGVWTVTEK